MTETEILLQLWADILADVQADKAFMQQVERAAQDAAFRTRSGAVRAEVMRRLPGQRPAGCGAHSYTAIWDRRREHADGDT